MDHVAEHNIIFDSNNYADRICFDKKKIQNINRAGSCFIDYGLRDLK